MGTLEDRTIPEKDSLSPETTQCVNKQHISQINNTLCKLDIHYTNNQTYNCWKAKKTKTWILVCPGSLDNNWFTTCANHHRCSVFVFGNVYGLLSFILEQRSYIGGQQVWMRKANKSVRYKTCEEESSEMNKKPTMTHHQMGKLNHS